MLVTQSCLTPMTPWTVAYQDALSMGFSRQEYWSGLQFLPPGDLPNPGIEPRSPALPAVSLPFQPPGKLIFPNKKQQREISSGSATLETEVERKVSSADPVFT